MKCKKRGYKGIRCKSDAMPGSELCQHHYNRRKGFSLKEKEEKQLMEQLRRKYDWDEYR